MHTKKAQSTEEARRLAPALAQSPHPQQASYVGNPCAAPSPRRGQCTHLEVPVVHAVEGLEERHWRGHFLVEGPLHPEPGEDSQSPLAGTPAEARLWEA